MKTATSFLVVMFLSVSLLVFANSTRPANGQTAQPNIVMILLDDLGKEGLQTYYRKTYNTPHIDQLGADGVRFSRFYADPNCAPTRVSLLTGLYPPRTGWVDNSSADCLDPQFGTFVQQIREAGYSTAAVGKWHICTLTKVDHPNQLGFDQWMFSRLDHWGAKTWINGVESQNETLYMPDGHTDFAIDFIETAAKPFFLYFATLLPHTPWDKAPNSMHKDWPKGDERYFWYMVSYADRLIGRIIAALKQQNLEEDTVVIFLTDNGTNRDQPGGGKGTTAENGINVPLIVKWPGTTTAGATRQNLADVTDIFPTILEMAGIASLETRDGYSLVPALTGKGGRTGREWIYAQRSDFFAIRKGYWKLREGSRLFNLGFDPFEEHPILPADDTPETARIRQDFEDTLLQEGLGPQ